MTITFREHADSRKQTQTVAGQGQRLRWTASGSTDQEEVRTELLATAPTTWDDLTLIGFDATPYQNSGHWDCTADYGYSAEQAAGAKVLTVPGVDDPLGPEFEFDISAKQAHITQSLRTVTSRYDNSRGGLNPPAAWAPGTAYTFGETRKNGSNVYICVQAGTSAIGGPTGTTPNVDITDGTCKWNFLGVAGGTRASWATSTAYTAGQVVSNHGFLYTCATSGTSASSGNGPTGAGAGITDGTAEWDYTSPDTDPAAPDYGQAIGVTRDRVNGTDIFVGAMEFSITAQYYPVTLNLLVTMLNLVGKFNQEEYYNFPVKTLCYMGCTGQPRPGDIWTLKHRFACSPNLTNVAVGSNITMPFKGGWDFLWACYRDEYVRTANNGQFLVQKPFAAYVEQTLEPGDFSSLPI